MKKSSKIGHRDMSAAEAAKLQGAPELIIQSLKDAKIFAPRDTEVNTLITPAEPWGSRIETGKGLRAVLPREIHGDWKPASDRPDPFALIKASNKGREHDLIPLRMQRMAASPFAFLRGATTVMAWDLAKTPSTGLNVVIDGDCHINNFGLFGTPQDDVVLDLNDFDEATIGPWEWDLKRLTASVNLAGRDNGFSKSERKYAVMGCVEGYRWALDRLQGLAILDLWNRNTAPERLDRQLVKMDKKTTAIVEKAVRKARASNNAALLSSITDRHSDGRRRLRLDPPITTAVSDDLRAKIIDALHDYIETLSPERRYMIRRYCVVDIVRRVVGVGSVGLRAYLILLIGNGEDDALFLQMKEAGVPAHAPYLPVLPDAYKHEGQRVVYGQKLLQAAGDPLIGWTTMEERPYYVRQMRNMEGAIPTEWLSGGPFNFFVWGYGALLARSHARAGDAAVISGYCGKAAVLDEALAEWAEAYGDQTVIDHAAFAAAVESDRSDAAVE
jgi:uncharacterized protein (DUF2252 family)